MNNFNRSNKQGSVCWLKNRVEDVVIHIKLQPQESITLLPKLEDYMSKPTPSLETPAVEEFTFKWQQKVFSKWQIQRYSDAHNCITETELQYFEILENNEIEASKVFTYVHEDFHAPLPISKIQKLNDVRNLNSCFHRLRLDDRIDKALGSDSMSHLFKSEENLADEGEQWTAMHVVFDKSDYTEDSQLLLKQEALLVSLYYNTTHNYLLICPDANDLLLNPYVVEPQVGVQWGYEYGVQIEYAKENGDELVEFLNKLLSKWNIHQDSLINFASPSFDKKQISISFELLTASGFDNDKCYIEYTIKSPENVKCEGPLHGRTHISKAIVKEDEKVWHYSHIVELELEMDADLDPKPVIIYLEMISTDWWGRHRTEGYTRLVLPSDPGNFSKNLLFMRPDELNGVKAEERRFFVGGCNVLKDLEVLSEPQSYDTDFKFTTTGRISVRWNTLTQCYIAGLNSSAPEPRSGSSSDVLLGAEAVLKKYKKARARLQAVTKDLSTFDDLQEER